MSEEKKSALGTVFVHQIAINLQDPNEKKGRFDRRNWVTCDAEDIPLYAYCEIRDGDGKLCSLGNKINTKVEGTKRIPIPHIGTHFKMDVDDPISVAMMIAADSKLAAIIIIPQIAVWVFIGLFVTWLVQKHHLAEEGLKIFDGSPLEWIMILFVFVCIGFPVIHTSYAPFAAIKQYWALSEKSQPSMRKLMKKGACIAVADIVQDIVLVVISFLVALFLSEDVLLDAVLNVIVLDFVGNFDNIISSKFIEVKYPSSHIALTLWDVNYYFPGANYNGEMAFWDCSDSNQSDVFDYLRSTIPDGSKKLDMLVRSSGLGILGTWPENHHVEGCRGEATVASVVMDIALIDWSEFTGEAAKAVAIRGFLSGATEEQWKFETTQIQQKLFLKHHGETVSRFSFSGNLHLNGWRLTKKHAHQIAAIICNSRKLKWMTLSDNALGDEGISIIADALKRNTTMQGLTVRKVGMSDTGATSLLDALEQNKLVLSHCLELGGNDISDAMFKRMQQSIGTSPFYEAKRGVTM